MIEIGIGILILLQLLTWLSVSGNGKKLRKIPKILKLKGWHQLGVFLRWYRSRNE